MRFHGRLPSKALGEIGGDHAPGRSVAAQGAGAPVAPAEGLGAQGGVQRGGLGAAEDLTQPHRDVDPAGSGLLELEVADVVVLVVRLVAAAAAHAPEAEVAGLDLLL